MTTNALPPIERWERMDNTYIPLPGGWAVQTAGREGRFQILNANLKTCFIADKCLHPTIERMAREIRAAYEAAVAPVSAVPDGCTVDIGFKYLSASKSHVATVTINFPPALDGGSDAYWESRNRLARSLSPKEEPK